MLEAFEHVQSLIVVSRNMNNDDRHLPSSWRLSMRVCFCAADILVIVFRGLLWGVLLAGMLSVLRCRGGEAFSLVTTLAFFLLRKGAIKI